MTSTHVARSSAQITYAVWKALFLREALGRLFASRTAWFWLLAEPIFHISYLIVIYTSISVRTIGGIDTVVWIMVGMLGFTMFRRTATQVMNAVNSNQALFAYRQVRPIDTVLVRGGLEGFLTIVISLILLAAAALLGHPVMPTDGLYVLEAFFSLWLIGMGFGLITSVAGELVPELSKVIGLAMMPLYILSGIMLPISAVPQPYRDLLLFNPLVHALEAIRLGFAANYYHSIPELNLAYPYGFALVTIFLGLALHRHFALRLTTQ